MKAREGIGRRSLPPTGVPLLFSNVNPFVIWDKTDNYEGPPTLTRSSTQRSEVPSSWVYYEWGHPVRDYFS